MGGGEGKLKEFYLYTFSFPPFFLLTFLSSFSCSCFFSSTTLKKEGGERRGLELQR